MITDLGVLEPVDGELTLTALHPGVTAEQVRENTGWDLKVADNLQVSEAPTAEELAALGSWCRDEVSHPPTPACPAPDRS